MVTASMAMRQTGESALRQRHPLPLARSAEYSLLASYALVCNL